MAGNPSFQLAFWVSDFWPSAGERFAPSFIAHEEGSDMATELRGHSPTTCQEITCPKCKTDDRAC